MKYSNIFIKYIFVFFLFVSSLFATNLENMSLRLQWKHQFEFAGFYAAKELGYYKEAGINLDILEYDSNIDIFEEIVNNKVDFAIWGSGVIEKAMNGEPIILLANYFKRSPLAIITNPNIRFPSELKGKSLMIAKKDHESANYHQMFKFFDMNMNDMNLIPSSFNIQDFIDKKVDAFSSFLTNEIYLLQEKGIQYNVLDPSNYGVELYDVNLFSSKEVLKKNPELVKKFIEASNRGWDYALKNKEKLVNIILEKYNTQNKTKNHLLYEAKEVNRMMLPKTYPIGSIDLKKVERIGSVFVEMGMSEPFHNYKSIVYIQNKPQINLTKQELNYIKNNKSIPISVMKDFSPFSSEVDGKYFGFVNDLIDLLSEKTGLKFEKVTGQWVKNLNSFKNKESFVIADISYKKEREPFTLFTEPYYQIPTLIFVKDDFKDYKGIESLKGKKVGIQKDIFYAKEMSKLEGVELFINESIEEMAKALSYGQIDAAIMNLLTMNHYIIKNSLINIKAIDELVLPTVNKEDLRFGVNPDKPVLFSIIQKGLASISNKEWNKITHNWIGIQQINQNSKMSLLEEKITKENLITNQEKVINKDLISLTKKEKNYLKDKTLKMCVSPNWMPFGALDENNNFEGFGADINKIISKKLDKEILITNTKTWQESLEKARNKECDILSLVKNTKDRRKYLNFTQELIFLPYVVVSKKENLFIDDFNEIKNKKFAIVKGYAAEKDLTQSYPEAKLLIVKSVKEALEKVQKGEVFGYIDATAAIGYAMEKYGFYDLRIISKLPMGYNLAFGVNKKDTILFDIFKKVVTEIDKKEVAQTYKKWVALKQEKVVDYSLIWKIIGITLFIIIIIGYWNTKLIFAKKEIEKSNKLLEKAKLDIEKKNKELEQLATTDKLTGIYNRAKLDELLQNEINRSARFNHNFGLCILDIDFFKKVNDTFGHQVGDEVLVEFSNILKNNTRKTDIIGRWGGEEFILIIPEAKKEGINKLIENLKTIIENTQFPKVGKKTASFGLTFYKKSDTSVSMLKRADDALYEAKNKGRNKIIIHQ